jgi:hypothetical protein
MKSSVQEIPKRHRVATKTLINATTKITGLDILSNGKKRPLAQFRHLIMYILVRELKLSVTNTAGLVDKDHSSVSYGVSQTEINLLSADPISKSVQELYLKLQPVVEECKKIIDGTTKTYYTELDFNNSEPSFYPDMLHKMTAACIKKTTEAHELRQKNIEQLQVIMGLREKISELESMLPTT